MARRAGYSSLSASPPLGAASAPSPASSPSAALALADELGLFLDLGLVLELEPAAAISVAITVSGSSRSVTPRGGVIASSVTVSPISHRGHVVLERVRDVGRQRLDGELARDLLEHAALLDAGSVVGADELEHDRRLDRLVEPDAQQVDVHGVAGDRVAGQLLDDDRRAAGAVDAEVEHRAGVGQRLAQHARVDLEGDRVLAAAVYDAGDLALAAQAPRRARSAAARVARR